MVNNVNRSVCRHVFGTALTCTLGPRRRAATHVAPHDLHPLKRAGETLLQEDPRSPPATTTQRHAINRHVHTLLTLAVCPPDFSSLPTNKVHPSRAVGTETHAVEPCRPDPVCVYHHPSTPPHVLGDLCLGRGESFSDRWRYATRTQARSAKDPRQDGPSVNGGGYCRQEEEQNRVGGNKATLECLEPPFSSLPSPSSMAKVTAPPPSDADLLSTLLMTDLQFPFGKTQCDDYRLLYSFPFSM
ncbi:unnamed protein product [Arctogadus glacialis]